MKLFEEQELEYEKKNQVKEEVKEEVKECIYELLERFWVLKGTDEKLYYNIKDNEPELKKFFRDTFRYRLIITYEMIKLEKIPHKMYAWMGNKNNNGQPVFKTQKDYVFLFCFLAFLEGKTTDQQFTLQNICETLQAYYPDKEESVVWKDGAGYQNRLSLVRILKYAVKMNLMIVVDQQIEDFSGNYEHDVLLQKTEYASYFLRNFQEDVTEWKTLADFETYLKKENEEFIERKHRYYRRLFLEPIVYHHEITEEEEEYVKKFYSGIENNILRHTGYRYERSKNNSLLVKQEVSIGDVCHPSESMTSKIVLFMAHHIAQRPQKYQMNFHNQVEIEVDEVDEIIVYLKETYRSYLTENVKKTSSKEIRKEILNYLINWNFAAQKDERTFLFKEGMFRIVGKYPE